MLGDTNRIPIEHVIPDGRRLRPIITHWKMDARFRYNCYRVKAEGVVEVHKREVRATRLIWLWNTNDVDSAGHGTFALKSEIRVGSFECTRDDTQLL